MNSPITQIIFHIRDTDTEAKWHVKGGRGICTGRLMIAPAAPTPRQ